MPAKTVFRPVESPHMQGLFIDHSFEQNLLREGEKRERHRVTLQGAPLSAVLGAPITSRKASHASSDSNPKGCPEGHPVGGLMIRKGIIAGGAPRMLPSDRVYAVCEGTIFQFLGVTDKEAAYATTGIAASKPQIFPIDRFWALLVDRLVYVPVHDQVYEVVNFLYPDGSALPSRRR